jgi:hypothetical protein
MKRSEAEAVKHALATSRRMHEGEGYYYFRLGESGFASFCGLLDSLVNEEDTDFRLDVRECLGYNKNE